MSFATYLAPVSCKFAFKNLYAVDSLRDLAKEDQTLSPQSLNLGGSSQHCCPPVKSLEGTVPKLSLPPSGHILTCD